MGWLLEGIGGNPAAPCTAVRSAARGGASVAIVAKIKHLSLGLAGGEMRVVEMWGVFSAGQLWSNKILLISRLSQLVWLVVVHCILHGGEHITINFAD